MDLEGIGLEGVDWIDVARDRGKWRAFVITEMKLRIPDNAGNFLSRCRTNSFLKKGSFHVVSYD
jgi:hypothetical protein